MCRAWFLFCVQYRAILVASLFHESALHRNIHHKTAELYPACECVSPAPTSALSSFALTNVYVLPISPALLVLSGYLLWMAHVFRALYLRKYQPNSQFQFSMYQRRLPVSRFIPCAQVNTEDAVTPACHPPPK